MIKIEKRRDEDSENYVVLSKYDYEKLVKIANSKTEQKHAHWESHRGYARCSHCGCKFTAEWEYCGHCGYKMDEEADK